MTYLRKIKKEIRLFGYYDNKIQNNLKNTIAKVHFF